ncbi:hypothetical protein BU17DRAFT_36771, partial [Hysterangium stoloniferum]
SRTLRYATANSGTSIIDGGTSSGSHVQVKIQMSGGTSLQAADRALFGHERPASERIHWMFSPWKDERVAKLMHWIQAMGHGLGTLGVNQFIEHKSRGALFVNADSRYWQNAEEPNFDWLSFDDVVPSYDQTLQESLAFYEPYNQVLVFVILLSPSGNSAAMWRRKIEVPDSVRKRHGVELAEITEKLSGRRIVITVDELSCFLLAGC